MRAAEARAELARRTPRSRSIAAERAEILNSGLAANLEMPHPIFIDRGEGPWVFDADGNRYLDTSVGFGLHILGHRHPEIEAAIKARTELGWMFGIHTVSQMKLATLLHEASPCAERVVFCNTGSEATMYAIRAARGWSGRERIALFDGCYHGAHDYGMWITDPGSPVDAPAKLPMGHGIPGALDDLVTWLPYRHPAAFDTIRRQAGELALVMVEGVQSSNPQPETGEFLTELAAVCREAGVLFAIDEVITGFRLAYGGAQERFGVVPDLATYGKVLGGGLPVGAVTGRADVMSVFTGLGAERGIFSGGTFSGNPLTMEAGAAAVDHLRAHPEIYARLDAAGDRLAAAVNGFCEDRQIPARMNQVGSMFHMFFQREPVNSMRDVRPDNAAAEKAFYLHALNRGVLVPGTQRAFLSAAHGDAEVDLLIEVFQDSLADVQAEGLFSGSGEGGEA
ncbi:MAG: aspartate aminotransferase family protein [Gammaproteobacteria bacterium]|nr:aspartate aminotransferase family protein [Gammaproteobacteria bacterium]|tara:strand:+ start:5834 stop:7189 length:1356 start_codon:yes stop_codon:yes gene_type:complete